MPKVVVNPNKHKHTGLQHVAFQCDNLDSLLGHLRPAEEFRHHALWAADHGVGTSFYWEDPERNVVEIYVNNFGSPWTATEFMKSGQAGIPAQIDPEKLVAARKTGALPWELHERAMAKEFAPAKAFDPTTRF